MDDAEIVAAISAGELDGLAAALGTYAAPLFEYCHSMAPEIAGDVVHDVFIVAWSELDGLRDPGQLYRWLCAVADGECLRRTLAEPYDEGAGSLDLVTGTVIPEMPPGLPGRVLSACADNTPAGRALRVSLSHQAGPFGASGFPKGAERRRALPRVPRRQIIVVAAVLVLALSGAGIAAAVTGGAPSQARAGGAGSGGGRQAGAQASPSALATATPGPVLSTAAAPVTRPPVRGATPPPSMGDPRGGGQGSRNAAVPPPTSPPPIAVVATAVPAPPQGVIAIGQQQIVLIPGAGGAGTKTFTITAVGGPVSSYTITVPQGLTVSPASGTLPAGGTATITVSATSQVPLTARLTVYPGGAGITVIVKTHSPSDD